MGKQGHRLLLVAADDDAKQAELGLWMTEAEAFLAANLVHEVEATTLEEATAIAERRLAGFWFPVVLN